ncbi:Ras-GEF domain-containing family member 1C [Heterocephalus glaber]|uniref:Ras-GEF domain-containing family member 1C n=1 Tax=Heterocephalus glaber TaxID=10181 RepID=G5C7A7_HETGA|nr:Ras-GEF domain-containing family member 1C [Heterocephalus glaber]
MAIAEQKTTSKLPRQPVQPALRQPQTSAAHRGFSGSSARVAWVCSIRNPDPQCIVRLLSMATVTLRGPSEGSSEAKSVLWDTCRPAMKAATLLAAWEPRAAAVARAPWDLLPINSLQPHCWLCWGPICDTFSHPRPAVCGLVSVLVLGTQAGLRALILVSRVSWTALSTSPLSSAPNPELTVAPEALAPLGARAGKATAWAQSLALLPVAAWALELVLRAGVFLPRSHQLEVRNGLSSARTVGAFALQASGFGMFVITEGAKGCTITGPDTSADWTTSGSLARLSSVFVGFRPLLITHYGLSLIFAPKFTWRLTELREYRGLEGPSGEVSQPPAGDLVHPLHLSGLRFVLCHPMGSFSELSDGSRRDPGKQQSVSSANGSPGVGAGTRGAVHRRFHPGPWKRPDFGSLSPKAPGWPSLLEKLQQRSQAETQCGHSGPELAEAAAGMPRTLSTSDMVTPGGLSLPPTEPADGEQAGQPLLDGAPSSASLDTLIQHLVPTADYYPEVESLHLHLPSSRLFIEPRELLARVCHLCIEQQQLDKPELDKASAPRQPVSRPGPGPVCSHTSVSLLPGPLGILTLGAGCGRWVTTGLGGKSAEQAWAEPRGHCPAGFTQQGPVLSSQDEGLSHGMCHLRKPRHLLSQAAHQPRLHGFCFHPSSGSRRQLRGRSREGWLDVLQLLSVEGDPKAYRKRMHQLLQALHQRLALLGQGPEGPGGADKPVSYRTKPQASIHRELLGVCSDPYTLAQQLTHVELPCFSDKTNNLEAYVKWFNRLCYLVATEICMPAKKKQRAQVIEFFIDVARECFNIGNFNSLMAIISGMNMSPVSRLKKTWAKVKTAKFFILEHQMDPTGNFCNYRTALRGAAHRSLTAHSSREKIVIPFFSLLIKDIYFLNEGCANRLPNGHVNFEKFLELAKQVGEFVTWKQADCPFEQNPSITHYLHTAPIFSEDGLYLASYESESPENQTEKERWKSLRSSILGKT